LALFLRVSGIKTLALDPEGEGEGELAVPVHLLPVLRLMHALLPVPANMHIGIQLKEVAEVLHQIIV
jgi:hypothetical protein